MKTLYSWQPLAGLLALGLSSPAQAQAPAWRGAEAVGTGTYVTATATDERGDVYVAGRFAGTTTLGGTTLSSAGGTDIFVAKRDGFSGAYVWARRAGGASDDLATSLAVANGNVYVGGSFGSLTADFGPVTLTGPGNSFSPELFVAKLTNAGTNTAWSWAVQGSGATRLRRVNGLAVQGSNVYAVGEFNSLTLTLDGTTLANAGGTSGSRDGFVAKFNDLGASASLGWLQPVAGNDDETVSAVAVSSVGVYVAGDFSSAAATVGLRPVVNSNPGQGFSDAFVARLSDNGSSSTVDWTATSQGSGYEVVRGLAASGPVVYAVGAYSSTGTQFGSTNLPSSGGDDIFVTRLNDYGTNGSFAWATAAGGSSGDAATTVGLTPKGLYVAGFFNSLSCNFGSTTLTQATPTGDAFVTRLTDNGSSAVFDWAQGGGGSDRDGADDLALAGGRVWLGGYTGAAPASFGPYAVPAASAGTTNGLLALLIDGTPELLVRQSSQNYPYGSTYDYGSVPVNTTATRFFYIHNRGSSFLTLLNTVTAPGTGVSLSYSLPTPPYNLAPGDSVSFYVSLRPTSAGLKTVRLLLRSDDPAHPEYELNLTVNGAVATPTAVTWTGAVSTDWATAGNWSPEAVPGNVTAVTIPATPPNQPLVSTAGATCASLTSAGGSSLRVTAPGHLVVEGNFTSNGTLTMTGGTLELKGLLNSLPSTALTGGTVAFTGTGLQLIGGGPTFWNLTIAGTGGQSVRQDASVRIKRVLRLARGFDTNGLGLFLDSDASGTAMVVNAGGAVGGTGVVYMQRYIGGPNAGLGYRHLSAPSRFTRIFQLYSSSGPVFTPVLNPAYNTTGNSATPFPTVFGFDEARLGAAGVPGPASSFDQGWVSPAGINDLLVPGRGYTVNLPGTALPTIGSGFLNDGPVAVGALSRSGTGAYAGYHLLGNPYPSPIDWDSVARPTGLDNAVYVFRSTGQYTGFYDSYVNGLGTLAGGEIAAMQGFFVHVSQAVPAFSFTNAARKTVYTSPTYRRDAAPAAGRPVLSLSLQLAGGGDADQAFIYFENGATTAADAAFDAGKLPNPSGLNLASQSGGQDFAINGLPLPGAQPLVLPLSVGVPALGRYELAVGQLANFAPGTTLYLRDALLGTLTPLSAATRYAFDLTAYTAPGRFSIEFRPAGALASAAQVLEAQVQVFPNPATAATGVTVAAPARARVTLLNALGQPVRPVQTVGATAALPLPTAGLAAGLYVLRIRTEAGEVSRRLVVE